MPDRIYRIDDNGSIEPLDSSDYDNEALLQKLVAEIPAVLAGGSAADDGWLLVKREMEIPDSEDSSGRWSLDHLFLDRRGVPTLVEVKRRGDTRIRREVVGQMLDYAANSVMYWSAETVRAMFNRTCENEGIAPDEKLLAFLGADDPAAVDVFWDQVKTNLEAEKLRLVFLADAIPNELKRIIEFLNGQMSPIEVLGIELPQFVSGTSRVLVPNVVGRTMQAEQKKRTTKPSSGERWTEEKLLEAIRTNVGASERDLAARILERVRDTATKPWFSPESTQNGGISFGYPGPRETHYPFQIYASGAIEFKFAYERKFPPFSDSTLRNEWIARLRRIPGFQEKGGIEGLPVVRLTSLTDESAFQIFMEALDWMERQLKNRD